MKNSHSSFPIFHSQFTIPLFFALFIGLLRLPVLLEPLWHDDEAITHTVGQALKHGRLLYQEIHDNKPPLLYYLAAFTPNLFTFKILLNIAVMLTSFFFAILTLKLFPKPSIKKTELAQNAASPIHRLSQILTYRPTSILISLITFAILIVTPALESNVPNGEIYQILPATIAILLLWQFHTKGHSIYIFFSGFFIAIASLFKQPALLDLITVLFFLITIPPLTNGEVSLKKNISTKSTEKTEKTEPTEAHRPTDILILLLGFSLPHLITVFYFAIRGNLLYYIQSAWFQNISYLTSWNTGQPVAESSAFDPSSIIQLSILGTVLFLIYLQRKHLSPSSILICTWFSVSLFATLLSSRPYPHYFIQLIPAFSLTLSLLLSTNWRTRTISAIFILLSLYGWKHYQFERYPTYSYYQNIYQNLIISPNLSAFYHNFDPNINNLYAISNHIKSSPNNSLFIWSNKSTPYVLTQQTPPSRFITAYHHRDFNGFESTINQLNQSPPQFILYQTPSLYEFPKLDKFITEQSYQPILTYPHFILFKLPAN